MKALLIAACIGAAVQWVIDWVLPALDKDGESRAEKEFRREAEKMLCGRKDRLAWPRKVEGRIQTPPRTREGYQPKRPLDTTPPDQGSSVQPMKEPAKPLQPDAADFVERYLWRLVRNGVIGDYRLNLEEPSSFADPAARKPKRVGIAMDELHCGWHYLNCTEDNMPEEIANLTTLVVHCLYSKKDETK